MVDGAWNRSDYLMPRVATHVDLPSCDLPHSNLLACIAQFDVVIPGIEERTNRLILKHMFEKTGFDA